MKNTSNLSLDKIAGIEYIGKKQTYDFIIPHIHNYIANGILVHNSGDIEQDADVVFLLWRDLDNYEESARNILEVKMAKNRQLGDYPAIKLVWKSDEHKYFDCYRDESLIQ